MDTERKVKHYRISWRKHLGKGTQERYMVIWGIVSVMAFGWSCLAYQ